MQKGYDVFDKQAEQYWRLSSIPNKVLFVGVCVGIGLYFAVITKLLYYIPLSIYTILGVIK